MSKVLKWNEVPALAAETAAGFRIDSHHPEGLKCGENSLLPIASGFVLKKGTLLTRVGASLTPHEGFAERDTLVFDAATVTGTVAKFVVLTIAGVTLTSTTNVMNVASVMKFFKSATAGATAASILAASGVTDLTASGTLGAVNTLVDSANRKIMFVSTSLQTNVSNLTVTLVDTANSPVDLSSHVTLTNLPLSSAKIDGILGAPINTVAGSQNGVVYTEAEFYSDFAVLAVQPDDETTLIGGAVPTMLATGLLNYTALNLVLTGTQFEVYDSSSPLAA